MPIILIALVIIEAITLWFVSGISVKGLGGQSWQIASSLSSSEFQHFPAWKYNILHMLGDAKKILPYCLVFIWLYLFKKRNYLLNALELIPRKKWVGVFFTHLVISLCILIVYDWTQFYGNQHEHWFGIRRIGLFSVLDWLNEHNQPVPIFSVLMLFIYRLSYTVNINLMIIVAVFPLVLVFFSALYAGNKKIGSSTFTLLAKAEQDHSYWKLARISKAPKWIWFLLTFLLIMLIILAIYYSNMAYQGRVDRKQIAIFVLIFILILFIPFSFFLKKRGDTPIFLDLNWRRAVMIVFLILLGFNASEIDDLIVDHLLPTTKNGIEESDLIFAANLCNKIKSTYMASAASLDESRILFEKIRTKYRPQDKKYIKENSFLMYLIFIVRLEKLEYFIDPNYSPTSINEILFHKSNPNDATANFLWLDAVNSEDRFYQFKYYDKSARRWRSHLNDSSSYLDKQAYNSGSESNGGYFQDIEWRKKYISSLEQGKFELIGTASYMNYKLIESIFNSYLSTPLKDAYQIPKDIKTNTIYYEIANYFKVLDQDPVWQANRNNLLQKLEPLRETSR